MSGGFFRGTSADQDTRFSNKQAKLLKSQKFAPELDHPVDMTKVKMDVIRPWIATRATELLGFEDEVLINFVYGLLDGKNVDGKKIQIQLTGFMEKNTGKFMKELWSLLLSAQKNISGVPQQFLDAKEEEQRKKKEENDRIAQEIQKKKEKTSRELEREKQLRIDSDDGVSKSIYSDADLLTKPRASSDQPVEGSEKGGRFAKKSRNERSSSEDRSNSRKGHKSRSLSVSSHSQRYSHSPIRRHLSPTRRSLTPPRRKKSPHARRRRSTSRSRHRSPSPYWRRSSHSRRSPFLPRRSPSPRRRRSRSPVRCRSPIPRRRSPSPLHRGSSPLRRRSPPPIHPISPLRRRSPSSLHHRSPIRRRSPSPLHRRSSPVQHRSPLPVQRRSPSPRRSPVRHWSLSRSRYESTSPTRRRSPKLRPLNQGKQSSITSPASLAADQISLRHGNRSRSPHRYQSPSDFRSSSRELENLVDKPRSYRNERMHEKIPTARTDMGRGLAKYDLSEKSPVHSIFRTGQRTSPTVNSQSPRLSYSPQKLRSNHRSRHDSPESSNEDDRNPPKRYISSNAKAMMSDIKHYVDRSDMDERKVSRPASHSSEEIEYGPGGAREERNLLVNDQDGQLSTKKARRGYLGDRECKEAMKKSSDGHNKTNDVQGRLKDVEYREIRGEGEHGKRSQSGYSDSEEIENNVKRHHKRCEKSEKDVKVSSDTDSQVEDRKEAKRRRKEEKRMRKEEKRRRREERHRKRLERRAAKHKGKATNSASPLSGFEKHNVEGGNSEGNSADDDARRSSHSNDAEDGVSEQKRLEIELRNKALESLRAKKAIG